MTSSNSSVCGIRVSLCNADLWQKFYPHNEMLVKSERQKLFPEFKFEIEGLVPDTLYTLSLHLGKVDNHKYAFIAGKWEEDGPAGDAYSDKKSIHVKGEKMGAEWMNFPVSFSRISITSNLNFRKKKGRDCIYVKPWRKYQPVITVKRLDNGCEEEFRLTMTEFITVTKFEDPTILELKKLKNKRWNRSLPREENDEQTDGSPPRKRANISNTAQPASSSTVASSNEISATVSPPTTVVTIPPSKNTQPTTLSRVATLVNTVTPPSKMSMMKENDEQTDGSAPRKRANTSNTTQLAPSSTIATSNRIRATVTPPKNFATIPLLNNGQPTTLSTVTTLVNTVTPPSKKLMMKENDEQSDGSAPRGWKRASTSNTAQLASSSTIATSNGIRALSRVTTLVNTVTPPSKKLMMSQNQTMGVMSTPLPIPLAPKPPSFGGLNKFQIPMMPPPTIAIIPVAIFLPSPMALTTTFPPVAAPAFPRMIIPPVPKLALNPRYNPLGMRNMPQMGGVPMQPPTQWNLLPGAAPFQNFTQIGNPGIMQQMLFNLPQKTNFNGAGPSTQ